VPRSRLLVQLGGLSVVPAHYSNRFIAAGIPAERLEFMPGKTTVDYFNLRREVDIVLDSFPCTGGTTTCDSLWMGVPVVTLVGDTPYSRGGASLLHAVGLEELIAQDADQYVAIAARLASDTSRLATMRAGLRERMRVSPLMDAERFTRNLEAAYRTMWRVWCESR
jgi:protein O-GlcNAc transferase